MNLLADGLQCGICMDKPKIDVMLTHCGHLHCWSCLRKWLHQESCISEGRCPSCRSAQVLPLIGVAQEMKCF
ncbi:hypothetical protein KP509_19G012000 [Ceratopteris richardii]|uniref:RING-type E3 ubiquitin transferase n=1 Tax=Ceratopteris richardii TaxID=49495 RepID=A0A8T2SLJ7_CERRI|nr:hypothetical protein KP509_19G012000 [Ceratopteris richardii]